MTSSPSDNDDSEQSSHDEDEMSNDSVHSIQSISSAVSNNTTTSLQDVELAEASQNNTQDASNSSSLDLNSASENDSKSKQDNNQRSVRSKVCQQLMQEFEKARKQFASSSFQRMNPVVLCILLTEAAERFAYYGFRASLVLYFTQELKMDDSTAISLFAFASYVANFTPICGALLGDGNFGRFQTIVCFGFVYWLGLIVLTHAAYLGNAGSSQLKVKRIVTMIGLALICTGTGGIKPCVSIFGADQVNIKEQSTAEREGENQTSQDNGADSSSTPTKATTSTNKTMKSEEQEKVRTFFSYFSMGINVGAIASFLIIPTIKGQYGFGAAFMVPTVFMCIAIVVFMSQRNNYVYRPHNVHGSSLFTTFRLCLWLLHNNLWSNKVISENFPFLEPGPVPLPSVLPTKSDTTVVEGIDVHVGRFGRDAQVADDNTSVSSMSMGNSMRSLSRSPSRSWSLPRASCEREDQQRDMDDSSACSNDSPHTSVHHGVIARSAISSRSPSISASPRRRARKTQFSTAFQSDAPSGDSLGAQSASVTSLQTSDRYLAQQLSDAARALNVLPIFAMLPCFWMLYDQQGSVWTLQASRMNLHGIMQPEQINVLNPVGLVVLIPVFDKVVYPVLERRRIDISPLRRMGWGMILVSFAFFISGVVEYIIDYRIQNELSPISIFWQIPQISLMTVAEIFISVTGLEFAYSVSPDRLKSFVMAAYLITIAKGDFWGGVLYSTVFNGANQAVVLHIFSFAMMFNLACYGYVVRSWELRHGLVSWDLFDKVLETESKHQRQYLCNTVCTENQGQAKKEDATSRLERGRRRWRGRNAKHKSERELKTGIDSTSAANKDKALKSKREKKKKQSKP